MYFSDHALQRLDSDRNIHYHHGVNSPRKEAYEIPLFIWYSQSASKPVLNETALNQPYSTANNYWLMSDWLGIQQRSSKACLSPLRECYQPQKTITMIDGNRNLLELNTLPQNRHHHNNQAMARSKIIGASASLLVIRKPFREIFNRNINGILCQTVKKTK